MMNDYRWIFFWLLLQVGGALGAESGKSPIKQANDDSVMLTPEVTTILQQKMVKYLENQEERAKRVLGQQLAEGRFILYIKSSLSQTKITELLNSKSQDTKLTSLPMSMSAKERLKLMAERLTVDQVPLFIGPLTVSLTFGSDVSNAQINSLKDATANGLGLDLKAGDTVEVKKADLLPQSATKDVDKLRHDTVIAEQKITQSESENKQLKNELSAARDKIASGEREKTEFEAKIRTLEEDLSIYKTPMGDIKKIIKGLELPLTVLPIALVFFVFCSLLFFLYLRLQGTKTAKFLEAADLLAQGMIRAGKGGANTSRVTDTPRSEIEKALQASENVGSGPGANGPLLLGEEIITLKKEALEAWQDLSQYPYLTTSELREWIVAGGTQTQKFVAVMGALGPVESVKLLQTFSPNDLTQLRKIENSQESSSKLPGYGAILQLHRLISTQILNRPEAMTRWDFPELVKASDETLANALVSVEPKSLALCFYILPESRRFKMMEAVSAKMQSDAVEGFAALDGTTLDKIDLELSSLKTQLIPSLSKRAVMKFAVADEITQLMDEVSAKTRASLQEALSQHKKLDDLINSRTVTMDDVLALDDETLSELLDEFSPEQTATLLTGLRQEGVRRIMGLLPRKMAVTVESELSRISSRQGTLKRAQNQSLEFQDLLRGRLKDLVDEGVVELNKGDVSQSNDTEAMGNRESDQESPMGSRESA